MKDRVNIYFEDQKVKEAIEEYSETENISFSRAILELAAAGLKFKNAFGDLNVELLQEQIAHLKTKSEGYIAAYQILRKNFDFSDKHEKGK
jgi:hypothetical protein